MLIIDAHLDLSANALQGNRNLLSSAYAIRTQEAARLGDAHKEGTVAFPEMRQGRVALSFVTLFARSTGNPAPHADYESPFQAHGIAKGQLAYYRALADAGHARIVTTPGELDSHFQTWQTWEAGLASNASKTEDTPPLGFVITMEGADPILHPDQLEAWVREGLRLLGLTHYGPGRYAGGTGTEIGLTDLCPPLLAEMERLGVILDLTHCSDESFWEALEHYTGPVLASHNNCRALVPHQRQFSDAQLRAIFERDGVIGAAFDTWMLQPGWVRGKSSNEGVTLDAVVDHIDYVCQLAGRSRHAAIGTDLDGGYGREQSPCDLDTIADLQKLVGLLEARGYSETDIAAIMHGNWLRFLHAAWG